jgi:hypothetical protein
MQKTASPRGFEPHDLRHESQGFHAGLGENRTAESSLAAEGGGR